jgi:serine/threonine protein kinase
LSRRSSWERQLNGSFLVASPVSAIAQHDEHPWLPRGHTSFAGKYTVERILGQGGMGVVFEARHIRLGQRVAIKVLGSALREYPELVERFEREARAAGSLTSAHAVRVFDIDATEDGTPFIVMELLAGRDLSTIVDRDGPQPVSRSVRWLSEACDAIAEAHRLGIIHRDLKPSNLFLTDVDGRQLVKVLDFGIAKRISTQETQITQAVAPLGTPQYMSPEQVRCAKDVDSRTDVWSLGVTLYEMVCGQTPFAHESASACIASIAADPVPDPRTFRPDLREAFANVLLKALAKNANERFQTVAELVAALAPFAIEDDEGEEELVSAVRRAYVLAENPVTPRDQLTLDGRDDAAPGVGASSFDASPSPSPAPVAIGPRRPFESRSDNTVPPAISLASIAPKRKMRSTLAMVSAGVLGLAALVLTPHWALSNDAPAPAAVAHVAPPAPAAAAELPAAAVAVDTAPATSTATAADVAPAATPQAVVVEAPAAPMPAPLAAPIARVAVAMGSSVLDAKHVAPSHKSDKTVASAAPAAPAGVHGGLSNPGF